MQSRFQRSILIFSSFFVVIVSLLVAPACSEAEKNSASDPRVALILAETGDLEERLNLMDSLRVPVGQDVVEALLYVMKDRSQQAFVTVPDNKDLGYHVEESPFGGPDLRAELRWTAIIALERLGEKQALPDLVSALFDRHPIVRNHAAHALWNLGNAAGVAVLIKTLEGQAFENETANRMLKSMSQEDFGFDTDAGWVNKKKAIDRWQAWAKTNPQPPMASPEAGDDPDLDRRVRFLVAVLGQHQFLYMEQARRNLSMLGDLARAHLSQALASGDLGAENQQLRAYAIQALSMIGSDTALSLVEKALLEDTSPAVRSRAAESIGSLDASRGNRGLEALSKALKDSDESVVVAVIRALGRRQAQDAAPTINKFFAAKDASFGLHMTAAVALARLGAGNKETASFLMRVMTKGAAHERAELAEGLKEWQGSLHGWDERKPAQDQKSALTAWRGIFGLN